METVPIIKIDEFLIVPVQIELNDEIMRNLQEKLVKLIKSLTPKGVLIDLSAVTMIDSFMARTIGNLASLSKLFDAKTVVVGIQPEIAITLVEMGVTLKNVTTALNVEKGMEMLRTNKNYENNNKIR